MVANDDVDVETLQAQIDMSMSFAHDLVTSWIKPTHLAQLTSGDANATQIIAEELRRPPRLGVGAPIPTAPPLVHEASKLQHKLGKSRTKNEGLVESQPQDGSKSDEEEHKGRPTKRRMKADPFGHECGKKKIKAEPKANSNSSVENVSNYSVPVVQNSALGEPAKHSQGYSLCLSMQYSNRDILSDSSTGKEMQRMRPGDQQCHVTEGRQSLSSISSPPDRLPVQATFSPSLTAFAGSSPTKSSREISVPVPGKPAPPECSRAHSNFKPTIDKAKRLGIPLLNLDGPPEATEKAGNTSELKKKRKRRKKKNHMTVSKGDK